MIPNFKKKLTFIKRLSFLPQRLDLCESKEAWTSQFLCGFHVSSTSRRSCWIREIREEKGHILQRFSATLKIWSRWWPAWAFLQQEPHLSLFLNWHRLHLPYLNTMVRHGKNGLTEKNFFINKNRRLIRQQNISKISFSMLSQI